MNFLIYNNTDWQKTEMICPSCKTIIYQEVYNYGKKTAHYCCTDPACTWATYNPEQLFHHPERFITNR